MTTLTMGLSYIYLKLNFKPHRYGKTSTFNLGGPLSSCASEKSIMAK